jgi:hypothetical protein
MTIRPQPQSIKRQLALNLETLESRNPGPRLQGVRRKSTGRASGTHAFRTAIATAVLIGLNATFAQVISAATYIWDANGTSATAGTTTTPFDMVTFSAGSAAPGWRHPQYHELGHRHPKPRLG